MGGCSDGVWEGAVRGVWEGAVREGGRVQCGKGFSEGRLGVQ